MKIVSSTFSIPAHVSLEEGILEAILDTPSNQNKSYIAICCHPHPQHGGTMQNKVVYTTSRTFAARGILSLRFNFRGVGNSSGEYSQGEGEQLDLVAAVNWVRENYPGRRLILAGFSFGARIVAMQASSLSCDLMVCVAPPIGRIDFEGFNSPECPWLVIQGDADELVDVQEVVKWRDSLNQPPEIYLMNDASHFFHGRLVELREIVDAFCDRHIGN